MPNAPTSFDAVVVGGGPAGLSAALTLARAGRRTAVVDSGEYRNEPATNAHGILTRDGTSPEDLRRLGRDEVIGYGGHFIQGRVTDAAREDGVFTLEMGDAGAVTASVLIVATGVVDELPDIPGLREAWGVGVVHCPYCHGAEHRGEPTAVMGRGESTYHLARLLRGWTDDITVVTNGPEDLDEEMERQLESEGTRIIRAHVARLRVAGADVEAIEFEDGRVLECRAVYLKPPQRFASPLAERLGARVTDEGRIDADPDGRTGVPGLFVAGDIVNRAQQVATAVGGGVWAGIAANHDLVCGPPEG
jgi:thioredoxin reductase (NADPH)